MAALLPVWVHGPSTPFLSPTQEHGPLLHLHFLATRPEEQRRGTGRQMLQHLERIADAGGV